MLDKNLKHYSEIVQKQFGKEIDKIEGAGAAGGLGSAFIGFLNAQMENGLKVVAKYCRLEEKLLDADFVFTGEGSIDRQTKEGKTPYGVAKIAKKYNKPVIAFCQTFKFWDKLMLDSLQKNNFAISIINKSINRRDNCCSRS